ncbi:MAG: NfeD family protein, partial [Thiotrichales bacterium]
MSAIEALFASPWLWLVAGAVLIGLEILAPGVFLLWIGLGAVLVGVSVWVAPDLAVAWQLLIFALAMLGSIALGLVLQRRGRESLSAATLNREL